MCGCKGEAGMRPGDVFEILLSPSPSLSSESSAAPRLALLAYALGVFRLGHAADVPCPSGGDDDGQTLAYRVTTSSPVVRNQRRMLPKKSSAAGFRVSAPSFFRRRRRRLKLPLSASPFFSQKRTLSLFPFLSPRRRLFLLHKRLSHAANPPSLASPKRPDKALFSLRRRPPEVDNRERKRKRRKKTKREKRWRPSRSRPT